jgi:deazaflavin-dependent oxidoreductase (nitroreductase family)
VAVAERQRQEAEDAPLSGCFVGWTQVFFVTIGRRTGRPHEKVFGPFAVSGDTLHLAEEIGERADWVRNALAHPRVEVRRTQSTPVVVTHARLVDSPDELARARRLLHRRLSHESFPLELVELATIVALDAVSPSTTTTS